MPNDLTTGADVAGWHNAHMGAPLRRAFVLRSETGSPSSLQSLLNSKRSSGGGGRGGRTRLALLLTLIWVSARGDNSSQRPARFWADLIGIGDGPDRGARVVATNLKELQRRGYVRLDHSRPGEPPTVRLNSELGTGAPYVRPIGEDGPYFRIPETLWTTGVMHKLDGPALVMYLMMLYYHRSQKPQVWFSPNAFHRRHGFSETTRLRGIATLSDLGMITITTRPIDTTGNLDNRTRTRRILQLHPIFAPPLGQARPGQARVQATEFEGVSPWASAREEIGPDPHDVWRPLPTSLFRLDPAEDTRGVGG